MTTALTIATHLLDTTDPTSQVSTSPIGAIIAVTLSGIASIVVAFTGYTKVRARRQREADAEPALLSTDPEDRPSRLRERLSTLEAWTGEVRSRNIPERVAALEQHTHEHDTAIDDLQEQLRLRRAVDVIAESDASPRRRARPRPPAVPRD